MCKKEKMWKLSPLGKDLTFPHVCLSKTVPKEWMFLPCGREVHFPSCISYSVQQAQTFLHVKSVHTQLDLSCTYMFSDVGKTSLSLMFSFKTVPIEQMFYHVGERFTFLHIFLQCLLNKHKHFYMWERTNIPTFFLSNVQRRKDISLVAENPFQIFSHVRQTTLSDMLP